MATTLDPKNLSSVYFSPSQCQESFVGPIQVTNNDVRHGKGVIATQDIAIGELLFFSPSIVSCNMEKVASQYNANHNKYLEDLVEESLLDNIQAAFEEQNHGSINGILCCISDHNSAGNEDATNREVSIEALLGKDMSNHEQKLPSRDTLRSIIRKNAFGPDGRYNYQFFAEQFQMDADYRPPRMLGIFPLAAMLNHSCVANAVRVYSQDCMIVHACQPISKGAEIVWSYVPPVQVHRSLSNDHGFACACERCQAETEGWKSHSSLEKLDKLLSKQPLDARQTYLIVRFVEDKLLPTLKPSTLKNYLRVGLATIYMAHFSNSLSQADEKNSVELVVKLALPLHLAFLSCHNASTEHLSILHMCYELDTGRRQYWMEQLKQAHIARYGSMEVKDFRRLLQHTRLLLRTQDGRIKAEYKFL